MQDSIKHKLEQYSVAKNPLGNRVKNKSNFGVNSEPGSESRGHVTPSSALLETDTTSEITTGSYHKHLHMGQVADACTLTCIMHGYMYP